MSILILMFSIAITIWCFYRNKAYVVAVLLVGQPILKLMLLPFPNQASAYIAIYYAIGFAFLLSDYFINNKQLIFSKKRMLVVLVTFSIGVFLWLSTLYSPDVDYGREKVIAYFTTVFVIVFTTVLFIKDTNDFQKLLSSVSNIAIIVGLITVLVVYIKTGSIIVRLPSSEATEIKAFGINFAVSIWYGRRMGLGFISSFFLYKMRRDKRSLIKSLVLLCLTALSISRGPIVTLLLTIYIVEVFMQKSTSKGFTNVLLALPIIVVVAAFVVLNTNPDLDRLFTISDTNSISRISFYTEALKIFIENPFGIGFGGFAATGLHEYPHNVLLEILSELGVIGFAILLGILFKCIVNYKYVTKKSQSQEVILCADYSFAVLLFAFGNALVSGNLCSNEYLMFSMALCSILPQIFFISQKDQLFNDVVRMRR